MPPLLPPAPRSGQFVFKSPFRWLPHHVAPCTMVSGGFLMASVARPPGPKGLPILGCLVDLRRRPLDLMLESARCGDVAYVRLPFVGGAYLVNHPEYIGSVLVDNAKGFEKSGDYVVLKHVPREGLVTSEG